MARLLGWEWQVKKELGLKAKLDPDFCFDGKVNNIQIHIYRQAEVQQFGDFHRVHAICPVCQNQYSAGRLNQHWNRVHVDKPWPTFYWDYQHNKMVNFDPYEVK